MIKRTLHKVPAWLFVVALFLLVSFAVVSLTLLFPIDVDKYLFFFLLFGACVLSRALETWQFGFEIHHLIIFCFSFVFGPLYGILFVLLTSVFNIYLALNPPSHMFVHTVEGPLFQTIDLLLTALVAGFLGPSTNIVLAGTIIVSIGTAIEKALAHKFAGIDLGRAITAFAITILVNNNLFLLFGTTLVSYIRIFAL